MVLRGMGLNWTELNWTGRCSRYNSRYNAAHKHREKKWNMYALIAAMCFVMRMDDAAQRVLSMFLPPNQSYREGKLYRTIWRCHSILNYHGRQNCIIEKLSSPPSFKFVVCNLLNWRPLRQNVKCLNFCSNSWDDLKIYPLILIQNWQGVDSSDCSTSQKVKKLQN